MLIYYVKSKLLDCMNLCSLATGNVLLDMEKQLQANSIRVNILEQENATLQKSLQKLRKAAQHNGSK